MGGMGGIGAFAGGFAKSFAASREQRRLRDLDLMREQQRTAHEERMAEEFKTQQDFRVKQQAAVEQYRAGQVDLQQKQLAVQQKHLDLDVMSGLSKAFDPKVPKPQRVFMLKQMFKTLEIDPKSTEAKDFMSMASGLDDEALASTKSSLLTMLPDATPGQITAFTKAIVSGQIQMKDALEEFDKSRRAKQLEKINSGTGGAPAATPVQTSRITNPTPMAQQQPGGDMPIPGMAQPGGAAEPTAGGANSQQLRDRAAELFKAGFTTEGSAQAQLARDLDANKNPQLKEVVAPDGKNMWVTEQEALHMEAPSGRPVKTPEEERLGKAATESVAQDFARVKPLLDEAQAAKATGPLITAFKAANKSGKFVSGSFSGLRENVAKFATLVGIDHNDIAKMTGVDIGDPAVAETMKSMSANIGIQFADKLGRATNMQVGYIQEALPSLMKTPRGNEIVVDLLEKTNQRALRIEQKYDEYISRYNGDLRPHGKPSFFEEADRIRREPLVSGELEKEIKAEAVKGDKIDVQKLWEKAQGSDKERVTIGEDKYDITGQFDFKDEKGKVTGSVPMIKLRDGKSYPYVTTPEEAAKLPPGTEIVRLDKLHGAVMGKTK